MHSRRLRARLHVHTLYLATRFRMFPKFACARLDAQAIIRIAVMNQVEVFVAMIVSAPVFLLVTHDVINESSD